MTEFGVFLKAVAYATEKHRRQRRKDAAATPYINHPVQVADLLWQVGVRDIDVLSAAILHDTIEDTDATKEELLGLFGENICNLVMEVTDDKLLPTGERKRLQIHNAPKLSIHAKWIRIADKICNVGDIGTSPPPSWDLATIKGYFIWTEKVVERCKGCHPELEQRFKVTLQSSREKHNF